MAYKVTWLALWLQCSQLLDPDKGCLVHDHFAICSVHLSQCNFQRGLSVHLLTAYFSASFSVRANANPSAFEVYLARLDDDEVII